MIIEDGSILNDQNVTTIWNLKNKKNVLIPDLVEKKLNVYYKVQRFQSNI